MKNILKFGALVCLLALLCLSQTATRAGGRWRVGGSASDNSAGHITLSSITLSPLNQSQIAGSSIGLTATAHYSNGSTFDLTKVAQWVSSNTAIVSLSLPTVGNTETALCNSAGTALISANFGGVTASTNVTCTGIVPPTPTLVSIAVTPTSPSVSVGQTNGVTATGTYSDGSKQPITASVNWTSGTPSVATIGVLGTTQGVICKSGGTSVITATDPATSVSGNTTVTCNAVLSSLVVTPASPSTTIGGSQGFLATGTYSDGSQQDVTAQANWTSGTPSVATVSTTRTVPQVVNAIAAGTSTITATVGSVSGNTVFTVTTPGGHTPPTVTSVNITGGTTVNVGGTLSLIATCTYSDGTTGNCSSAPTTWTSSTANTSLQLPDCIVGLPCNITLPGTGSTPRTWSLPAKAAPVGAYDLLDWALMPLPDRNNFCLTGGATPKCFVQNAGMFWWVKSFTGWAADMQWYDDTYVYEGATENNDASQQAACQAAGYSSCFLDPFAYKMAVNLSPAFPRYFVPGSRVELLTPPVLQGGSQVNPFIRTTNCGADNQPLVYLGNKKFVTTGPFTDINFGGSIGTAPYIENDYYYSGSSNGVYVNLEKRFFVKGFGWARFELWQWNGSTYVLQSGSTNNIKTAHAAVTPNFGCGVPPLPITGGLPHGALSTAAAQLTINDSTGTISGSASTAGSYSFTAQEEDGTGTFHLFPNTLRIDQTASAAQETLTGVSAGTSLITATVGAVSGNVTVTVQTPAPTLSSIAVTPTTPTVYTSSNTGFTATGTYSDGSKKNLTGSVVWSSGTPAVATIGAASNPQTVNCLTVGTSVITATMGVSGNTTLTCQAPVPPSLGVDAYCGAGNVPSFGTYDAQAAAAGINVALPTTCYYTNPSARPSGGTVRTITAATWNSVWASTACGDVIEIPAGVTLSGNFVVPSKVCDSAHYIKVRVQNFDSTFPAYGTFRGVSGCYWGVASLPGYPSFNCTSTANRGATIQSTGAGIPVTFTAPSSYQQWEGIRFTRPVGTGYVARLLKFEAAGFDHFVFAGDWCSGTAFDETQRCMIADGISYLAWVDYLATDFHCTSVIGSCTANQAFSGGINAFSMVQDHTWKFVNGYINSADNSSLGLGGGVANTTPADIEVRLNWIEKLAIWNPADPTYNGGVSGNPFIVKQSLETKNSDKLFIEGNYFNRVWAGFSQVGSHILLTPKNQANGPVNQCPNCFVTNTVIRYNYFSTSNNSIQIANVASDAGGLATAGNSYSIHDNVFDNLNYATCYKCSTNAGGALDGGAVTALNANSTQTLKKVFVNHNSYIPAAGGFLMGGTLGVSGPTLASGAQMSQYTWTNNLALKETLGINNPAGGCSSGAANCYCGNSTPTAILASCFGSTYSFGGSAIVQPTPTNTLWPGTNCTAESSLANILVNYANGNAGVANLAGYKIKTSSPCHNAGTDGTDPGADINTLLNRIQNVASF